MTIELVPQVEEKLSPLERLEALCDPGSLTLLRSDVRSRRMGEKARAGDGVIAGAGRVDGRPVFCYAQDPTYLGGSLGEQHADSIVRVLRLAGRAGAPVVGFIESGGARMQEGLAALAGYARIFSEHVALSGQVPQISVICGASAGGGSYSPALTDFVVMTERGEHVPHRPGGREGGHGRGRRARSSSAARRCTTATASRTSSRAPTPTPRCSCATCSTTCPRTPAAPLPVWRSADPVGDDPGDPVPAVRPQGLRRARRRSAAWSTAAGCSSGARAGRATSSAASRASTGKPVGIVANQPRYLGGVLDADSATKARALRAHLQRVRHPAARARRHARLPARHASRSRAA